MNNDPNKRPVRIFNAKTGEYRLSQPVPVHTPHQLTESEPAQASAIGEATVGSASAEAVPSESAKKSSTPAKPKVEIETLEQFIEYAYSRKGQRVTLKPKVQKVIAQQPKLDEAAVSRLLVTSAGDTALAVPRQLLLLCREIEGYPALRAEIVSFVSTVMDRHPVFADPGVHAALRHLPEALPAEDALLRLMAFRPAIEGDKEALKGTELTALRRNASHLFVAWLAHSRSMSIEKVAELLFSRLWMPAARELDDDNARLRSMTEIEQLAGVGVACDLFRQRAIDAHSAQDQALRESNDLRLRLTSAESQASLMEQQRDALQIELHELRQRSEAEVSELRRLHEVERTHLRHEQEQLRGRLRRRLDEGVEMLEVGLTALRNKTPRVEVMIERAETVVDALRAEKNNLREE